MRIDLYGLEGTFWDYSKQSYNNVGKFSYSAYQSTKTAVVNTLNNPRFQGSMQAVGGLAEAGAGRLLTLGSRGILGFIGAPIMAHGMDNYITGMNRVFSGTSQDTITSQLLQKTGMSSNVAGMVDSGISILGSFGGVAAFRSAGQAAFRVPANWKPEGPILFGQSTVSTRFSASGDFKGMPVSEIVHGLRNGTISPNELPLDMIVRNGQRITLNNRSLLALKRAGIKPSIVIDQTGIKEYEEILTNHLEGRVPSDVIRVLGGLPNTSLLYPLK
jgi:hypothetical protein